MPFRALGLGPKLLRAIQDVGYTEPTPIQSKAIPEVLAGHDVIGIAQTGTGKTAAFVLPILQRLDEHGSVSGRRGMRALVLTPTRELAAQIEENVRDYGRHNHIRHATIIGGVGERPQIDALRRGVDIVVATPGRLIDLMGQGHVVFSDVEVLVLDEADRMLDMGFIPAIRRIVKALPSRRQTLLFSASLSAEIEKITSEFLRSPRTVQIGRRANPAESVAQFVYEVPKHLKLALLIHLLQDSSLDSVLVFSRTKHGADKIAKRLVAAGINTSTLHSNRSQNQRIQALKSFKSGAARVLVATDIAARGIDVEGISHVINFDFPMHSEDYVHRIGRTGRAHAIGDAISFVTPEDHASLRSLEKFIGRGIPRHRAESFDYSKRDERPAQEPQSRHVTVRRTPGGEAPRHHPRKPQARTGFAPRIDRGQRERIGTPSLRGMGPRPARRRP